MIDLIITDETATFVRQFEALAFLHDHAKRPAQWAVAGILEPTGCTVQIEITPEKWNELLDWLCTSTWQLEASGIDVKRRRSWSAWSKR